MALKIVNSQQLNNFLVKKPVQWSHLVSVRALLRVLPLTLNGIDRQRWLPNFRTYFICWAAGRIPTRDFTVNVEHVSYLAVDPSAMYAARVVTASSASDAANFAARVVDFVASVLVKSAPSHQKYDVLSIFWKSVEDDLIFLSSDESIGLFAELALLSPWRQDVPDFIEDHWRGIAWDDALAIDYSMWIIWYQSLLTGNGPSADYFGPGLTLRIAQQPDEWWDRPAAEVNADIAAWLRERDNQKDALINKADEVQKQLVQRPAAASFGWTGDQLSVNAPAPLAPASLAQDFLDEVRVKALDLRDRLAMTNAAPRVRNSLNGVIAILPEQATDLRPGLLRSRARSLHADAKAYAGQFQDGELPVDATAMLLDLSGGLRDLEGCFPELRDIEREIAALNLKPADVPAVQRHLEEINKVASASPVVTDNAKAVMAAGTETMKAEATPEIIEVRTAEQALTTRNLVNAALQGSLQQILSRVPGTTGRVYDETEKAGLNVIRPVVSVGTALALGTGATVLFGGFFGPVIALAALGLAEYDRLPGIINFIKAASNANKDAGDDTGSSDSDGK